MPFRIVLTKINHRVAGAHTQSSAPSCIQTKCKCKFVHTFAWFVCLPAIAVFMLTFHSISTLTVFPFFMRTHTPSLRPTPQTATTIISKFTLHASSLPKPQQPISISVTPRTAMDTKNAKQAANSTKRSFQAQREISADSGIGSMASQNGSDAQTSPQRHQHRPRNLEMVFNGRHKFHVRDLPGDDSFSDDNVVPLTLPELPSAFNSMQQQANLRSVNGINLGINLADLTIHLSLAVA